MTPPKRSQAKMILIAVGVVTGLAVLGMVQGMVLNIDVVAMETRSPNLSDTIPMILAALLGGIVMAVVCFGRRSRSGREFRDKSRKIS